MVTLRVKSERQARLSAGVFAQARKEFALAFGVSPLLAVKLEVVPT